MKIVGRGLLQAFCDEHADARNWIKGWIAEAQYAKWTDSHDIKSRYPSASFLSDNLVIFNVKGNSYRLEAKVAYKTGTLSISWIGTHAEYDKRNKQR